MKCRSVASVILLSVITGGLVVAIHASEETAGDDPESSWERIWDRDGVDATIRRRIAAVDPQHMSQCVCYLAKDPLPYRKLNFTLPGHAKNTLHEADDDLAGRLQSWGYGVEREGVRVQTFRRDKRKPKHAQYSPPMPDDPWYTACSTWTRNRRRKCGKT